MTDPTQRLVWIEQKTTFKNYFKPFSARLDYPHDTYKLAGRVAFIVNPTKGLNPPEYRQLAFNLRGKDYTDTFDIRDPNPDSFLVVLAMLSRVDGNAITSDDALDINVGIK